MNKSNINISVNNWLLVANVVMLVLCLIIWVIVVYTNNTAVNLPIQSTISMISLNVVIMSLAKFWVFK